MTTESTTIDRALSLMHTYRLDAEREGYTNPMDVLSYAIRRERALFDALLTAPGFRSALADDAYQSLSVRVHIEGGHPVQFSNCALCNAA